MGHLMEHKTYNFRSPGIKPRHVFFVAQFHSILVPSGIVALSRNTGYDILEHLVNNWLLLFDRHTVEMVLPPNMQNQVHCARLLKQELQP